MIFIKKKSLSEIVKKKSLNILWEYDVCYSNITTIKLGGNIKYLAYPKNIKSVKRLVRYLIKYKIKYIVIGNGSNTLITNYDGVVISLKLLNTYIKETKDEIIVSSNISQNYLALKYAKISIDSFLFGAMVPGLIGGAIMTNAGVLNFELKDYLKKVKYIDSKGKIKNKLLNGFRYRYSPYNDKKIIILEATFIKHFNCDSMNIYKEIIKKRNKTQPKGYSLGSIFKNGVNYKAGALIEGVGLKGFSYGGIKVSNLHSNIIINENGNIEDFLNMIFLIELKVLIKYGIRLEKEIKII